jgi:hypothetical protein
VRRRGSHIFTRQSAHRWRPGLSLRRSTKTYLTNDQTVPVEISTNVMVVVGDRGIVAAVVVFMNNIN